MRPHACSVRAIRTRSRRGLRSRKCRASRRPNDSASRMRSARGERVHRVLHRVGRQHRAVVAGRVGLVVVALEPDRERQVAQLMTLRPPRELHEPDPRLSVGRISQHRWSPGQRRTARLGVNACDPGNLLTVLESERMKQVAAVLALAALPLAGTYLYMWIWGREEVLSRPLRGRLHAMAGAAFASLGVLVVAWAVALLLVRFAGQAEVNRHEPPAREAGCGLRRMPFEPLDGRLARAASSGSCQRVAPVGPPTARRRSPVAPPLRRAPAG